MMFSIIHCLHKNQSCKAISFVHLSMWPSDGEIIFLNQKFKDNSESLNTDDVLGVLLKTEKKNALKPNFKLKCSVFSNTIFLGIRIFKTCSRQREMAFFLCKSKSEKRNHLAIKQIMILQIWEARVLNNVFPPLRIVQMMQF